MLFDPEKKTRIDDQTQIPVSDPRRAESKCRKIAEELQQDGKAVRHVGIKKVGRAHKCIQEWEVDD